MMTRLLMAMLLGASGVFAGTITGTVRALPKPAPGQEGGGGNYESRRYKFVERINYDELKEFVVFIDQPMTNTPAPPPKPLQVITQRDAVFRPHVLPVLAGTTVEWPNKDTIYHNVFSYSEGNAFDLGLYKDPTVKKVPFNNPGRVDVFCSIHKQMSCVILVLQNPWFASTNEKGQYRIASVPAGTYKLKAWHEFLPPKTVEVTVPAEGEVRIDFELGVNDLPKY